MPYLLAILAMTVIFVRTNVLNTEQFIEKKAHDQVYEAMINATHDASLQLNVADLTQGEVVFDQAKALQVFEKTLTKNLPVNTDLSLKNHSLITQPITILNYAYVDDNYIDPVTGNKITFPYTYTYYDSQDNRQFTKLIEGPSVVFIIKTKLAYSKYDYYIAKTYEYKGL